MHTEQRFYVDVAPGVHDVSATTEVTDTATVTVKANQTSYVECSINMGILIGRPIVVEVTPNRVSRNCRFRASTDRSTMVFPE
ncbi:MAG: hypothetical protein GY789_11300 [Hyphomicrobiales bacterium]|nr:hypothetical protein [Hyphomicrobiales bacterium]MCP4998909.1 hypothetical protein [Hyphomicrobiales bacterium]